MTNEKALTMARAVILLGEAAALISRAHIPPERADAWARMLVDEPPVRGEPLTAGDVRAALRRIAREEHGEWWRLEIAEILREAKRARRERLGDESTPAARPSLPPETPRGRVVREVARAVVEKRIAASDFEAEVRRRMQKELA